MAAEEYLFLKKDEEWIFLYVNEPCVIIGSNQAVMNEVDLPYSESENIAIIRRLSGGGAVYHDFGNLNYCFIWNKTENPLSDDFLKPIIDILRTMNIPAEMGKRKDLWLNGYKISGTASHVSKGRELHHGTLLYDTNLEKLKKALNTKSRNLTLKASPSVPSPVKNISEYLSENNQHVLSADEFFLQFIHEIMCFYELRELNTFNQQDIEAIKRIQEEKYDTREWNYRM